MIVGRFHVIFYKKSIDLLVLNLLPIIYALIHIFVLKGITLRVCTSRVASALISVVAK